MAGFEKTDARIVAMKGFVTPIISKLNRGKELSSADIKSVKIALIEMQELIDFLNFELETCKNRDH